jgi:uncharacterized membrane protein
VTAAATNGSQASAYDTVDRRLGIAIGVLSVIGIGVAGYLTYTHYEGLKVLCLSSGGCETVQSSVYSKLDGIPVAVLGLAGYIGILFSLLFRNELARAAGFGLALVGFLFSMYLTYRELFTIKAICQWCVGSAVIMTVLTILTAIRVLRVEPGSGTAPPPPRKTVPRAERRRIERRQAARR